MNEMWFVLFHTSGYYLKKKQKTTTTKILGQAGLFDFIFISYGFCFKSHKTLSNTERFIKRTMRKDIQYNNNKKKLVMLATKSKKKEKNIKKK